jgi:RND family efflux transporter MFP subunit
MDLATTFAIKTRPARRLRRRSVELLLLIAVLAVAITGWRYVSRPQTIEAAPVRRGPVAEVVYATGFVEPRRPVAISSRVTAPVTAVLVDEGDRVSRGQALAFLDSVDQRQTITQLAAQTLNAEQDERRALMLFKQGWTTRAARDRAVATASAARAAEAAARARLDQYAIRAGISGVILRRDVEPGDLATAAKTLFELGDSNSLRVTATVDERDIPLVRKGANVMMSSEAYPGRVIRGRVYEITPGGDPDQRAFRVRIAPDAAAQLPIGLTLEVNIMVSEKQRTLLVPAGAIRDGAVWVVEAGRARKVAVTTGNRGTGETEIVSGVGEDACIVRQPRPDLEEGQRVKAQGC